MEKEYDVLIFTTAKDFLRLANNYHRLVKNMPAKRLVFVGSDEVGISVEKMKLGEKVVFFHEDDIIPFADVHAIMKDALCCEELPRGITGWYYQQFLKMQYSFVCKNEYYLVWDGDTIPCRPFSMFREGTDTPYLDLKREYHEEYFVTIGKLFPGMYKCIEKSFISEHMLMNCGIMQRLISDIMCNEKLHGKTFYERIIRCIEPTRLQSNSFSEFETYGTYVAFRHTNAYKLRDWHSLRYGGFFFDPDTIADSDYEWLGKDFDAISFEKGHAVHEDAKYFFNNKEYQEKLRARQILEIVQEELQVGHSEVWDDRKKAEVACNDKEYLIYEKLGEHFLESNPNQAFLCYENAEFLCQDSQYKQILNKKKEEIVQDGRVTVCRTSIVIVSYNSQYLMQQCVESIRETCAPGAYQLVIVDNASSDGIREWLREQKDILLIQSDQNLGFPLGCNVGIQYSEPANDIFLLNNDTRMAHNSLFWLRMGLYENDRVGAVGAVSNYAGNEQIVEKEFMSPAECLKYAERNNVFRERPYEERNRLCGFAMMIRREALNKVGEMDINFSPGYYDDDDLSMRIWEAGYRLFICHNSFIYHTGSQSFQKRTDVGEIVTRNYYYLLNKWKYDIPTNSIVNMKAIREMDINSGARIRVLELGAGFGGTLSRIQYLYPNAEVVGVEKNEQVFRHAVESVNILLGDWTTMELPFEDGYFDYIIYTKRGEETVDGEKVRMHMGRYLKGGGLILV